MSDEDYPETIPATADAEEVEGPEVSLKRVQVFNIALVVLGTAAGFYYSTPFGLGFLLGGVVMAINFSIIAKVIHRVFLKNSSGLLNIGTYWLKFVLLMFIVGALVIYFKVDVFGLLAGLSTILVSVTAEAVLKMAGK